MVGLKALLLLLRPPSLLPPLSWKLCLGGRPCLPPFPPAAFPLSFSGSNRELFLTSLFLPKMMTSQTWRPPSELCAMCVWRERESNMGKAAAAFSLSLSLSFSLSLWGHRRRRKTPAAARGREKNRDVVCFWPRLANCLSRGEKEKRDTTRARGLPDDRYAPVLKEPPISLLRSF